MADPPVTWQDELSRVASLHETADPDSLYPLATGTAQENINLPHYHSDSDESDDISPRRPPSEWLPFRYLRAALVQQYDANRVVSEALLTALPTRQHGAFLLYEILMREGREFVRRQRCQKRAATALRAAESAAAVAVGAAIDAARAEAEEATEVARCKVYSKGTSSCNHPWRTCPQVVHAESRERAGLAHRETTACARHPLILRAACHSCSDRQRLQLLFTLLPPHYEANSGLL